MLRPTSSAPNGSAKADGERIEVAWVGSRPQWLDRGASDGAFEGLDVSSALTPSTRVVHVGRDARTKLTEVDAQRDGAPLVLDLGSLEVGAHDALRDASDADVVLVESESDVERALSIRPELEGRLTVAPAPVDLDFHAPEEALERIRGAYIKRFRRLHRLAHPTILFVGPYTRLGGLDVAVQAAYRLRESLEDLRLAAVPLGEIEPAYLDECEMEALALGHRGIIEWTCSPEERRFWYATATVVCCPWRGPAAEPEAPLMAAAAARPFVGSDLALFRRSFRAPGAPSLVPPGDVDAIVGTLAPLVRNIEDAEATGRAARIAVESEFSEEAAASRLASLWSTLAVGRPQPARAA